MKYNRLGHVMGTFFILALFFYFITYGFTFPPCPYTETVAETPPELVGATVQLDKDQWVGMGMRKGACGKFIKSIENHIINNESINNITVGKKYFEGRGLTVEVLARGEMFKVEKVVAKRNHSLLSRIFEGSSTIYYLILRDANGELYEVATVFLGGTNPGDEFMSVFDKDDNKIVLSHGYFSDFYK